MKKICMFCGLEFPGCACPIDENGEMEATPDEIHGALVRIYQRHEDALRLLQRAYTILADQDYDDDTCRLLSEIESSTGIGMEDSDVTSR